ncbi:hypothetical protein [Kitasatospora aureofaciens]|uniref:hypothetical protein n=1 Tax=Kitasatospora aureofaciens TaxID=1894 RepID=UPI0005245532|nr:hypothetical protein [Kitasatospora aureofaciens]
MTDWTPGELLADVVKTALNEHDVDHESHGRVGSEYLVTPLGHGPGEITAADADSGLSGTIAKYTGLCAYYYPAGHRSGDEGVRIFRSADLGAALGPTVFAADLPALLSAVTTARALAGSGDHARRRLAAEATERFRHHTPHPATYCHRRAADGTVALAITATAVMDAQAIAAKLYAAYSKPYESGAQLPALLTVADVMQTLAAESAGCADGWHFWESEPGHQAYVEVHPWAQEQVRRLFPELTWPHQD